MKIIFIFSCSGMFRVLSTPVNVLDLPFASRIAIYRYVYKSLINKRWITLPVVYSRPFASKAVFWAILKEVEFAVYCSL